MTKLNSIHHRLGAVTLAALIITSTAAAGTIIGHADVEGVATLPQATMDAIGQQKWLFTHASVGGNMLEGMAALHAANASRYPLTITTAGSTPPATTTAGTIYDADRGNPGWSQKFTLFNTAVRTNGWRAPKVGMVMDKLCYIDQTANPTNYVALMTALERDFPDTVIVYATMPLMNSEDTDNRLRNDYNNFVRAHCQTNPGVLFDIADIEAHRPDGTPVTFTNQGKIYQKLYSAYTSDGGHLNATGEQRVALGWYATAAALALPLETIRLVATQNAHIDAAAPDSPFQEWGVLDVFSYRPVDTRRVLLQFDLSALPAGAVLTSAKLGICSRAPMNYVHAEAQEVWRIGNDAWSQATVTWNNFVSGPSNYLAGLSGGVGQHYSVWELDLAAWNPATDLADGKLSVLIKYPAGLEGDYYYRGAGYYSRAVPNANNGSGQPDADIVPYLEITYAGNPPVIPPPLLQFTTPTTNALALIWNTFPGWSYQVQANPALETTNWTAVTGTNYASELFQTNPVTIGTNSHQFFRVWQFPR